METFKGDSLFGWSGFLSIRMYKMREDEAEKGVIYGLGISRKSY